MIFKDFAYFKNTSVFDKVVYLTCLKLKLLDTYLTSHKFVCAFCQNANYVLWLNAKTIVLIKTALSVPVETALQGNYQR